MVDTYLLLGTNMGDRVSLLSGARSEIGREVGTISQLSAVYETAAWGHERQPSFLNQVVVVATPLQPLELLGRINGIEKAFGRQRAVKWGPRPLDIDILFYGDRIIDEPTLQVPHPRLPDRRFALVPMQEIAPFFLHPQSRKSMTELLDETTDHLPVNHFNTDTHEHYEF